METAGMQVVLGADYSNLEQGFTRATAIMRQFNSDVINATTGLKELFSGGNIKISSNIADIVRQLSEIQGNKAISIDVKSNIQDIQKQLDSLNGGKGILIDVRANVDALNSQINNLLGTRALPVEVVSNLQDIQRQLNALSAKPLNLEVRANLEQIQAQLNSLSAGKGLSIQIQSNILDIQKSINSLSVTPVNIAFTSNIQDIQAKLLAISKDSTIPVQVRANIQDIQAQLNSLTAGKGIVVDVSANLAPAQGQIDAFSLGFKNLVAGISPTFTINTEGFGASMTSVASSSKVAGDAVSNFIAQATSIPPALVAPIQSIQQLAQSMAAMSGITGGSIGITGLDDVSAQATRAAQATAQMKDMFTAADATAQIFINSNVNLNNSIETNVAIVNNYRTQLAALKAQEADLASTQVQTTSALDNKRDAIASLGAQQNILKQQIAQGTQVINAQSKEMITADDSMKSLQNNLTLVSDAYRRLSAADRDGVIGQGMLTQIKDLGGQLKDLDGQMGNFQRNVGNYGGAVSQLGYTMTRSFHGLAELFIAPNRALLILSNDIPQLFSRLREGLVQAKAAGDETASMGKILASSFDATQLAIQLGVTALIVYAPKLYQWATGAKEAAAAAKELKKEQDGLKQAFESGASSVAKSIVQVQSLAAAMNDANAPTVTRISKYNELLALYPQLAGSMDKEKTATNDIKGNYDSLSSGVDGYAGKIKQLSQVINTELIPALRNQAIAQGFASQAAKIGEELALRLANQDTLFANAVNDKIKANNTPAPSISQLTSSFNFGQSDQSKAIEAANKSKQAYAENEVQINKLPSSLEKLFSEQMKYSDLVDKSVLGFKSYKDQLEESKKANEAVLNTFKAGTPEWQKQFDVVQKIKDQLKAYDPKPSTDGTKAIVKANDELQRSLINIKAQLDAESLSPKESDIAQINAYKKAIESIFVNHGDTTSIDNYRKAIANLKKDVESINVADILKGLSDFKTDQSILVKLGFETNLESLTNDLNKAKEAVKALTTGANKLPFDSSAVKQAQKDVSDLTNQVKGAKIGKINIDATTSLADIQDSLNKGIIEPLEAANEKIKTLTKQRNDLLKSGAPAEMILPVKIELQVATQDKSNLELNKQIDAILNKDQSKGIVSKLLVKYDITTNTQEVQQNIQADKQQFQHLLETVIPKMPDDVQKSLADDIGKAVNIDQITKSVKNALDKLPPAIRPLLDEAFDKAFTNINTDKVAQRMAEIGDVISKNLQDLAKIAITGAFDVTGDLLANKKDLPNLFNSIETQLGQQIESFGIQLVEWGITLAALKSTFLANILSNPALAIAAGVALGVLGATIKAVASKQKSSTTAFADGGIVYGQTNAIIAEYPGARSNPEVVAPLNKLKSILGAEGAGVQRVIVEGQIRNDHIAIANKRALEAMNR